MVAPVAEPAVPGRRSPARLVTATLVTLIALSGTGYAVARGRTPARELSGAPQAASPALETPAPTAAPPTAAPKRTPADLHHVLLTRPIPSELLPAGMAAAAPADAERTSGELFRVEEDITAAGTDKGNVTFSIFESSAQAAAFFDGYPMQGLASRYTPAGFAEPASCGTIKDNQWGTVCYAVSDGVAVRALASRKDYGLAESLLHAGLEHAKRLAAGG